MGVLSTVLIEETEWSEIDEQTLVEQAKTDKEAFGELYRRYVEKIYNYIYYRTGNREDAEDLTARVFQRALKHVVTYEDKGLPFTAWLYRIAHNLVANHHRDSSKRSFVSLDEIGEWRNTNHGPETLMQMVENEDRLLQAIRRLPQERQDLVIFKFLNRMPNSEIGAIMGRSEGAVKSLYHRTLLALREDLGEDFAVEQKEKRRNLRFWQRNKEIEA
jgi:RNA polymerase sigma-70 factor (ECF subfamily)